jgi:ribonuclease M5
MIKEIIVVEGKDDTTAIQRAVEADTIETGGSAINAAILKRIKLAQQRRGAIIFTDPDHAGERIRKIITERVPGCKHAFLTQEEALYKGNIGVENAPPDVIRRALENVRTEYEGAESQIDWNDLLHCGLINHSDAANRRLKMGNLLGIGYCNGKQFYKRCKMFQISQQEFQLAYQQITEKD